LTKVKACGILHSMLPCQKLTGNGGFSGFVQALRRDKPAAAKWATRRRSLMSVGAEADWDEDSRKAGTQGFFFLLSCFPHS
jgi:hypothetical protein